MKDKHTDKKPNRLISEKSPYLLQHAHNPVDWYGWGEEAFQRAKDENKPVFLSIGYSTCHWCHVMERESFENQAIADILNDHFISIKVDREERPDVDQIYMYATQAMTGGGGWPMSVFLFPDKRPFYAGTYFPPQPRQNQPGFPELLQAIQKAWQEKRDDLMDTADRITDFLQSSSDLAAENELDEAWSDKCYSDLCSVYDERYHGFGSRNKFPRPSSLEFLLSYGHRRGNYIAMKMAEMTLFAMGSGGMYDHIGGGFHRYSVDPQWRVPHFEKMLYDQAQLVVTYLKMYTHSKKVSHAGKARETLDYVLRNLHHPEGGFYSAEDADSADPYNPGHHSEGAYYLWKKSEIDELLSAKDAEFFSSCYNIREHGNALEDPAQEFINRNIPYLEDFKSSQRYAEEMNLPLVEVEESLGRAKQQLLERRENRVPPHLDDKIITAWNGLMISGFAQAGRILGEQAYSDAAEKTVKFIYSNLFKDGDLQRSWRDGEARHPAVMEDYAFLIQGLLDLYAATFQCCYLKEAITLSQRQIELFAAPEGGFYSSRDNGDLPSRMKETYDGAEPAGNSVSAFNFLRLGRLLNRSVFRDTGLKTIGAFAKVLREQSQAMPLMLTALEYSNTSPAQLVIVGEQERDDTKEMIRAANMLPLPNLDVLLVNSQSRPFLGEYLEFIRDIKMIDGKATAYSCKNYTCTLPVTDPERLLEKETT